MRLRLDSRLHQVWRCLKHSALVLNVTLGIGISAYVAPAYNIIWLYIYMIIHIYDYTYIYNIAIYLIRQSLATWTLRRGCKSTTKWSTYPEVLRTQHTLKACVLDMKSMSCIHCGVRTDSMYMYIYIYSMYIYICIYIYMYIYIYIYICIYIYTYMYIYIYIYTYYLYILYYIILYYIILYYIILYYIILYYIILYYIILYYIILYYIILYYIILYYIILYYIILYYIILYYIILYYIILYYIILYYIILYYIILYAYMFALGCAHAFTDIHVLPNSLWIDEHDDMCTYKSSIHLVKYSTNAHTCMCIQVCSK